MQPAPTVSVIIPTFNRSGMVGDAIRSALAQTYRPLDIVVVDDGSTDETPDELERWSRSGEGVLIRKFRQPNAGPGPARNLGLSKVSGEYIQYLDSDDLLHPEKVEKQVKALRANPDAGVAYCITLRKCPENGEMRPWARTAERIDNLFPSFLPKRGWATLTPLWRRSVCDAIGPWGDFRVLEDWDHDLRAGMLGVRPVHVPEPLCTVRDHDEPRASGMNSGFTRELTHEFFKAHESVWEHMKQGGFTDWSYVQRFSRTMFWIARMCGGHGLIDQAELALRYTDEMTELNGQRSSTKVFRVARKTMGWKFATSVAEGMHQFMRRLT